MTLKKPQVYTEESVADDPRAMRSAHRSNSYGQDGYYYKVFFRPGVTIPTAVAIQILAVSQTILHQMRIPGRPPHLIHSSYRRIRRVPVLQSGVGGSDAWHFETGTRHLRSIQLRVGLITVPGIAIPYPYGRPPKHGSSRLISRSESSGKDLTQNHVVRMLVQRPKRWSSPSGHGKTNTPRPDAISRSTLNNFRAHRYTQRSADKTVDGHNIRVKRRGQVRDGYDPQRIYRQKDWLRSVLMVFLRKTQSFYTQRVGPEQNMPWLTYRKPVNSAVRVKGIFGSISLVRAAKGVVREGVIAGAACFFNDFLFLVRGGEKPIGRGDFNYLSVLASSRVVEQTGRWTIT